MEIIKISLQPSLDNSTESELGSGVVVTIERLDLHQESALIAKVIEEYIINNTIEIPGGKFSLIKESIRYKREYAKTSK